MTIDSTDIKKVSRIGKLVLNIRSFSFHYWWLAVIALLIRRIPFAVTSPQDFVILKKTVLITSYLLLVFVLARNWKYFSVRLILVGVLMNFAAIAANGGLMPVTPEARDLAGMIPLGPAGIGQVLPQGSGILLTLEQTRLWFLTDIIPIWTVHAIFSVGDAIMFFGLFLFIAEVIFRSLPGKVSPKSGKPAFPDHGPACV